MDKHFVEGVLGNFYITDGDPKKIEKIDEDFLDSNDILFSFDNEGKDEPYKSIVKYYSKDLILSKEALEKALYTCRVLTLGIRKALREVKSEIAFTMDTNKDIVKSLLDDGYIDKKTYDKLVKFFNKCIKKQYEFISNFDFTTINLERFENNVKTKTGLK